jgi:hypothetical protein
MRELLEQGVDPDDFETEDAEYNPSMTDEELDAAHADMREWLRDTAPVSVHPKMTWAEAKEIYARHGLIIGDWPEPIATVLGGLEAEIAALQEKIEALTSQRAAAYGEIAALRGEIEFNRNSRP